MILLSGPPGVGKSTFSERLARAFPVVHLESDAIRRELFRHPRYDGRENAAVFAAMRKRARAAMLRGETVLIDSTNLRDEHRERFVALARELQRPYVGIRLWAHDAVIRERLRQPRHGNSTAGEAVYLRMRGSEEFQKELHLVVHTGDGADIEPAIEAVHRLVNTR